MPPPARDRYRPIADYGVIGDCESAALVASDGAIDWWCPPRFDSPSVFAAILDKERGGFFRVHGGERCVSRSAYVTETNVLRTEFRADAAAFELVDFMPVGGAARPGGWRLFRLLRGLRGASTVSVEFAPRFDYGRVVPRVRLAEDGRAIATGSGQTLALASPAPLDVRDAAARATFPLREGEEAAFAIAYRPFVRSEPPPAGPTEARAALEETSRWWRAWIAPNRYRGPHRDAVVRSALVLKLLAYEPSGAVVAAPTSSLPERVGGVRNWDYRYAWVRDAVFAVRALSHVGHPEEARRFVAWIVRSADPDPAKLRVLYSVGGEDATRERTLDHLEGYRRSRPVRVGNAAETQFQLDVYGELVEGAHDCGLLDAMDGDGVSWTYFRALADLVARRWREPDHGIWEVRSPPRHFVLSKAMAWAALHRASDVARRRGLPGDVAWWAREAEACRGEAVERGFDEELGAFRQAYETPALDAANLLLPLIGFLPPRDPRVLATIDRTIERLTVDGLVYRYLDADDGVAGGEAAFTCCTFWLVEALAIAGRVQEARRFFEGAIARATPLGLFAEELDPVTGEHLGNCPQGFPHIGLVRAAQRLERAEALAATPGARGSAIP